MTTESIVPIIIDTSGLHCPMPLLKLKMALRNHNGTPIRLISTDPMSQQDIKRYCEIIGLVCKQEQINNSQNSIFIFNIIVDSNNKLEI
ncbi:MAG: sulfurtransferase TusA family protein [Candidatus Saccharibacteria bacterium]|nr:sulfurtransferase TusA family protein [Moraxellaceae bacterium]